MMKNVCHNGENTKQECIILGKTPKQECEREGIHQIMYCSNKIVKEQDNGKLKNIGNTHSPGRALWLDTFNHHPIVSPNNLEIV